MAQYDAKIIQDHADQLYAQADKAPLLTAYSGALIGLVIGLGWAMGLGVGTVGGVVSGVILALVAGSIGYSVGRSLATRMRVDAQTALCQVAIEQAIRRDD